MGAGPSPTTSREAGSLARRRLAAKVRPEDLLEMDVVFHVERPTVAPAELWRAFFPCQAKLSGPSCPPDTTMQCGALHA